MIFPKFPLVTRRSRDETVGGLTRALEMARHKAAAAEGAAAHMRRWYGQQSDFQAGQPVRSDTSRFGTPPDGTDPNWKPVDSGSMAAITAVALRKFNENILLQADFRAQAQDETTLKLTLGGEKWVVTFTPANLEN